MPARIFLFLLFVSVLFSGCFELIEDVNLHADGSGSFGFEINMSQSKIKLSTMAVLDSFSGVKIPSRENISVELEKATKILSASEGVSHVVSKKDFENYIFSLHFDFSNINTLNLALHALQNGYATDKTHAVKNGFAFHGKIFERFNEYDPAKDMSKISKKDLSAFEQATLTCVYRFDHTVTHFSNTDAKLSKNGKALLLKLSLLDILYGTKNIADKIELKD